MLAIFIMFELAAPISPVCTILYQKCVQYLSISILIKCTEMCHIRGVLGLPKFYVALGFVSFVLGRFSDFNIAIVYSNFTFCGAYTPSFCEFT